MDLVAALHAGIDLLAVSHVAVTSVRRRRRDLAVVLHGDASSHR